MELHGSRAVEAWRREFWAFLCYSVRWVQLCGSLSILWHCLSLGLEWKMIFSCPMATAEFSEFAGILSSTTASSFRIWSSSTGIPSPPLTSSIVVLPKAHVTSRSRMSGFRWVITPSWLSASWRSFLYSFSVYSCHLFLISSASVRSLQFLSFIEPIFAWNVPLVFLIFLKRSLVFPILLFSSISLHWSLKKAFLSFLAILWNSAFSWVNLSFSPLPFTFLLFIAVCKSSSDNHFAFLHLFWGMVLIIASYTMSWTSVHSSSGTLSDVIPWIYLTSAV